MTSDEQQVAIELRRLLGSPSPLKIAISSALDGSLKSSNCRSLYWRLFTGLLPTTPVSAAAIPQSSSSGASSQNSLVIRRLDAWEDAAHNQRTVFAEKNKKLRELGKPTVAAAKKKVKFGDSSSDDDEDGSQDVLKENPLSNDATSEYAKQFERKKIEALIDKDMQRLWSDDPFFEEPEVQQQMKQILSIFCCDECLDGCPGRGYRQGMHEILSLVVFQVHRDAQAIAAIAKKRRKTDGDDSNNSADDEMWEALADICSPSAVTADSFNLFCRIMSPKGMHLESWYHGCVNNNNDSEDALSENKVVDMARRVQGSLLKKADEALNARMTELEIQPTAYLLRWLRLLFLREFSFANASLVWDAVLAEYGWLVVLGGGGVDGGLSSSSRSSTDDLASSTAPQLVNTGSLYTLEDSLVPHMAIVMLLFIRADILENDFSFALRRLMRYPPVEDVKAMIFKAIGRKYLATSPFGQMAGMAPPPPALARPATPSMTPAAVSGIPGPLGLGGAGVLPPPAATSSTVTTPTTTTTSQQNGNARRVSSGQQRDHQETTATLRDRQIRQGMLLTTVIRRLEGKWFPAEDLSETEKKEMDEEYLVAIAELKKVRDVLLNSIPE